MWNGGQMLGDSDGRIFNRFTASLDVIGHELTHGVTQFSTALGYSGETAGVHIHGAYPQSQAAAAGCRGDRDVSRSGVRGRHADPSKTTRGGCARRAELRGSTIHRRCAVRSTTCVTPYDGAIVSLEILGNDVGAQPEVLVSRCAGSAPVTAA